MYTHSLLPPFPTPMHSSVDLGNEELLSPLDDPIVNCKWNDDDEDNGRRRRDDLALATNVKPTSSRGDLVIDSTKGKRKVHIEPEADDEDDDNGSNDDGGDDEGEDRRRGNSHNKNINNNSNGSGLKRQTPIVPDGSRIIKIPKDPRPTAPVLDDTSLRDLETAKKALQVKTDRRTVARSQCPSVCLCLYISEADQ